MAGCAETINLKTLFTEHATTGWQIEVFRHLWMKNPNLGDKLMCIGRSINTNIVHENTWGTFNKVEFLFEIKEVFWKDILRFKERVVQDELRPTQLLKELLARDFVINRKLMKGAYYIMGPMDMGLVHKTHFFDRRAAQDLFKKIAIKPHCTIKKIK